MLSSQCAERPAKCPLLYFPRRAADWDVRPPNDRDLNPIEREHGRRPGPGPGRQAASLARTDARRSNSPPGRVRRSHGAAGRAAPSRIYSLDVTGRAAPRRRPGDASVLASCWHKATRSSARTAYRAINQAAIPPTSSGVISGGRARHGRANIFRALIRRIRIPLDGSAGSENQRGREKAKCSVGDRFLPSSWKRCN